MSTVLAPSVSDPERPVLGVFVGIRASSGHDVRVRTDAERRRRELGSDVHCEPASEHQATLRQVGWLDQKGRIWLSTPSVVGFDGGSLTPLLIDARD